MRIKAKIKDRNKALALLILAIGCYIFFFKTTIKLVTNDVYHNQLLLVVNTDGSVIDSYTVENSSIKLETADVIKYIFNSAEIQVIHPLLKKGSFKIKPSSLISKSINLNIDCWCADKLYPQQVDLTLIYNHFADIEDFFLPSLTMDARLKAVENYSKDLYMLTAIASPRLGKAKMLHKKEVRKQKKRIGKIIASIYRR